MTKQNEKLALQMEYLRILRDLNEGGDYRCSKEIGEAIEVISGGLFDEEPLDHFITEELLSEVIKRGDHESITEMFSTEELTKELDRRAENPDSGVKVHKLSPHGEHATLNVNGYNEGYQETITGAHIYVVTD